MGRLAAVRVPGLLSAARCQAVTAALANAPMDRYDESRVFPVVAKFGPAINDHRAAGELGEDYWDAARAAEKSWSTLGLADSPGSCAWPRSGPPGRTSHPGGGSVGRCTSASSGRSTPASRCTSTTRSGSTRAVCSTARWSRSWRSTSTSGCRRPVGRPCCGDGAGSRTTRICGSPAGTASTSR
ncbi:hypothetical protein NKG94_39905 [Micromonospora sp. M12]